MRSKGIVAGVACLLERWYTILLYDSHFLAPLAQLDTRPTERRQSFGRGALACLSQRIAFEIGRTIINDS